MLHEMGHYLYGLGDEYKGCQRKAGYPRPHTKASIMEYSFGNNTRYKRKDQGKEYKVLGGFDEFWKDYLNEQCEIIIDKDKVVTDFCHHNVDALIHNSESDSEHNLRNERKSCWFVMIKNCQKHGYPLEDPFDGDGKLKTLMQMHEV
jgi:hypothetical protein